MKTDNDVVNELASFLQTVLWPLSVAYWIGRETWMAVTGMTARLSQLIWLAVFIAVGLAHTTQFDGLSWAWAYVLGAGVLATFNAFWDDESDNGDPNPVMTMMLIIVVTVWHLVSLWRIGLWVFGGPASVGGVGFVVFTFAAGFQRYRGGRRVRFPWPFTARDEAPVAVFTS